jgi:hypothetical protein
MSLLSLHEFFLSLFLIVFSLVPMEAGACDYNRSEMHLMQCRPVDLTESESVSIRLVCECEYAAIPTNSGCSDQKAEHHSFFVEAQDVRHLCEEGSSLCESTCPPTLSTVR